MMGLSQTTPHYGGQMGLAALLCMLSLTGCVAFTGQSSGASFLPAWGQSSLQVKPISSSEATLISAPAATFIVRFNDEPELEQVYRNFRRDEAGTRAAYMAWASQHGQLKGLHLVRASYSGELILALPANDPAGRSPREVIAALETIANLAYAEIDELATTSIRN
jgi:hypothetical protein